MTTIAVRVVHAGEPRADLMAVARLSLTPAERARMDRFLRPRDQWLFVLARRLVRNGLRDCFGIESPCFVEGAYGKPGLRDDRDVAFNISHTAGFVAGAFARGCELGIDVERADHVDDADALARDYLAPSERDLLARTAPASRRAMFLRLWVLKEAIIKADGRGLSLPLDSFAVSLAPLAEPSLPGHWTLREWALGPAARMALAVRHGNDDPPTVVLHEDDATASFADLLPHPASSQSDRASIVG
jgi:4'-phosphopantetheinyl transferase